MGPVPEVVIYGRSPSVVVDDVAAFVDFEHGIEFTVDDYVHGLFQCGCKVLLDATRLSAMYLRRSTRPVLPPYTVVASMSPAVSLYHSWLVS